MSRRGDVLAAAIAAFENDADKVRVRLRSPLQHLGGRTPSEMLVTEAGIALVLESLGAIAYGGVG